MKERAPRNRTLTCSDAELGALAPQLLRISDPVDKDTLIDRVVHQDVESVAAHLPPGSVDLLILDPPYNLTKNYHGYVFKARDAETYTRWFREMIELLHPVLTPTATIYVCSDWRTSTLIFPILDERFHVRNRITWEREKGRGAKHNWKNNTEDIWFCTRGEDYCFNVDDVKLKKRVIAPYRATNGEPKDWRTEGDKKFRLTHPSNLWSDITVPFWSMPENTDHPTQKPEKLIAKLILASSNPGDFVLDPFLGSGTTAVVARKLGRHFCGIERNQEYACWALKRLLKVKERPEIQGYADGVFWERNSLHRQQTE